MAHNYNPMEGVKSTAAIAGHPLHPVLIPFPIAFLVGALLTDIVYWQTGAPFWARMSFVLVRAGFVTGVLAAILGLIDFWTIERARAYAAGWIHFLGNAIALALTLANWLIRRGNPVEAVMPWGLALSVVVALILGVTGWYGGELAYRYKIGVIEPHHEQEIQKPIRTR